MWGGGGGLCGGMDVCVWGGLCVGMGVCVCVLGGEGGLCVGMGVWGDVDLFIFSSSL